MGDIVRGYRRLGRTPLSYRLQISPNIGYLDLENVKNGLDSVNIFRLKSLFK
jgi:hypothetical protein